MSTTTTETPLVYDPYDYAIHEDPYPTYRRLRDEAPVYRNEERDFWALSRHADVTAGFRDNARLSNSYGVSLDPASWTPNAHRTMSFLGLDPPRHTRMRGLVSRGFTPRRVAEMEARVRELSLLHLEPAIESGTFDFIADYAGKLPMDVISEMIGVPQADRAEVRRLADLVVHRDEGMHDVPVAGMESALALAVYYGEMVSDRRKQRRDDLTSALLDAEVDGDRLTDEEIVAFLFLMVVAGNETTTKLLGHALYWSWRHPGERAKLLAEPTQARVEVWVEETLRYDTSSQMLARISTEDIELHGQVIPSGSRVLLLVGSANRDPDVFADPDTYDVDRVVGPDLASFGFGRHFCMGASLARMEARVALEQILERVEGWEVDEAGARRVHSVNVRGFAALPMTVEAR
jgi:hypothetical protein